MSETGTHSTHGFLLGETKIVEVSSLYPGNTSLPFRPDLFTCFYCNVFVKLETFSRVGVIILQLTSIFFFLTRISFHLNHLLHHEFRQLLPGRGSPVRPPALRRLDQQHGGRHVSPRQHHPAAGLHGRQRAVRLPLHLQLHGALLPVHAAVGLAERVRRGRVHLEPAAHAGLPGPDLPPPAPAAQAGPGQRGARQPVPGSVPAAGRAHPGVSGGDRGLRQQGAGAEGRGHVRRGGQDAYRPALLPALWEVRGFAFVLFFIHLVY